VVHKRHLPAPFHVRVGLVLVALGLPRAPHRRPLLRDADQHHPPLATLPGGGFQQRPGELLFVLALGEVVDGDVVGLRPPVHLLNVGLADLAERRRRRNRKTTLPAQEVADHPH
jgi:hypothetical protein